MKESGLEGYEYFAYISYCDEDAAFAKKLQRHLEKYKLPVLLSRQYPRTPRKLTPVFRDDLPQSGALARTKFLIPICTETSARVDEWGGSRVDAEVHDFVTVNPSVNRSRVIPIIYRKKDGARATACIPAAVKALDLLALDVLDKGYEQVCNQLVSRMVGIKPGILWNRWLRKARKNMAILAAISFTVLLAALVAIGGGPALSLLTATLTVLIGVLCAHWYTTPRIALFERFIEANNLPVGIRKLSAKQALCRAYHYRFTYRGFRLVKVECCNSSGVPLPQQRPGFTHDEVACMELFYNERGQVNRQHWFDEHGMPLREVLFEQQDGQDWVNFRSPGGDFADSHLLTKKDGLNSPVTRYQVQRNTQGHITEVHYCNTTGAFCADCDGTWGRRYAINTVLGVVTERTYLDEKGAAMPNREGVAGRTYEYDSAGRMLAFSNVNAQGEAMFNHALVATMRCKLDAHGNRISVSYHAPNGQRELCHQLMAEKRTTYDTRGFITAEAYFDKDGKPTINRDGFSRCEYTRNAAGSMSEVRYFDTDGKPCIGSNLIHHAILTLDEYGNCNTASYFNTEDKPCFNADHAHHIVSNYDEDGRLQSRHYFNEEKQPTYCHNGYHSVEYAYDEYSNLAKESYFGTDEHPCHSIDGISTIIRKFDTHHNCIQESYLGTDGQPCIHATTRVASRKMEYNHNNKVQESYYDINEYSCRNNENVRIRTWKYDKRGVVTETRYTPIEEQENNSHGIALEEWITNDRGLHIKKYSYKWVSTHDRIQFVKYAEESWIYNEKGLPISHIYATLFPAPNISEFEKYHQTYYRYDEKNHVTGKRFVDKQGKRLADDAGISCYIFEYDVLGNVTSESYYGPDGTPMLNANGYFKITKSYNSRNYLIGCSYYDTNCKPCLCNNGYASMQQICDEYGRPVEISYFDTTYHPTKINGYSICQYQYNHIGNITKGRYLDEQKQPVLSHEHAISSFICEYDSKERIIKESYLDEKGAPCNGRILGISMIEWAYNDTYKEKIQTFKNKNGEICNCIHGYAYRITNFEPLDDFDSPESNLKECFYNSDQKLIFEISTTLTDEGQLTQIINNFLQFRDSGLCSQRHSHINQWISFDHKLIHYNEQGEIIKTTKQDSFEDDHTDVSEDTGDYSIYEQDADFDEDVIPENEEDFETSYKKGLEKLCSYDSNGNLTEESYVDSQGCLHLNDEDYARKVYRYNQDNKLIEEAFYDTHNNLCSNFDEYARKTYSYNLNGKLIEEAFYDTEGNLTSPIFENYVRKIFTYNQNNTLAEETWYDSEANIIEHKIINTTDSDYKSDISNIQEGSDKEIQCDRSDKNENTSAIPQSPSTIDKQYKEAEKKHSSQFSYFAFISYSSKDVFFANKLQKHIESFNLPASLLHRYPRAPRQLKPIFRDRTDLEQGNLSDMLMRGLRSSKYLLVICSENSAQPNRFGKRYIDMEVNSFIALNPEVNKNRVIPIIYRENDQTVIENCIPPAISEHGLEGIDILKEGMARTLNLVSARMAGIEAEPLWQHHQKKKTQIAILTATLSALLVIGLASGGIYAFIIAILSSGLLLTLCIVTAKNLLGTRVIKYARFIEENNLPLGIRELSHKEATRRNKHYKFYYQGYKLKKVECCNSYGQLVPQERPGNLFNEVAKIELFYDDKGDIIRQLWSDTRGIVIRDVRFEVTHHYERIIFNYPNHSVPAPHHIKKQSTNTAVTCYIIKRNKKGHITEILYSDHAGIPCADIDGTWGRRYIYNEETALISALYCLDSNGDVGIDYHGIAGRIYYYDEHGNMTRYTNVDKQGIPVYEREGFAKVLFKYDLNDNCTEITYLSASDSPILNKNLVTTKKISYKPNGLIEAESLYNQAGELSLSREGYAQCRYNYNAAGTITSTSFYDDFLQPCRCSNLYHKENCLSNKQGNIIQYSYYDEQGNACYGLNGVHQIIREYDDCGNLTHESYYDIDKNPSFNRTGYHKVRYECDYCGNIITETYFNTNNSRCYNSECVSKIVRLFDAHNNCIKESYLSLNDKPCINTRTGVLTCVMEYNRNNFKINEKYVIENSHKGTDITSPTKTNYNISKHDFLPESNENSWIVNELDIKTPLQTIINNEGIYEKNITYNSFGYIQKTNYGSSYNYQRVREEEQTFNQYGYRTKLLQFSDSTWGWEDYTKKTWEYDKYGYSIKKTEGLHIKDHHASVFEIFHETHYVYDERRNIIVKQYTDKLGNHIANNEGISEQRFTYDRFGRQTSVSYYDTAGSPTLKSGSYARIETVYNEYGYASQYKYYDTKGQPCRNPEGYSSIKLTYLPNGKVSLITYVDELDCPISIHGYTQVSLHYNHAGHILQCQFMNEKGELVINEHLGISIYNREYDINGRIIREYFSDENGNPCRLKQLNICLIEWEYDTAGRTKTVSFKDEKGIPCNCIHEYAHRTTHYDPKGYISEEVFKDKSGKKRIKTKEFEYSPLLKLNKETKTQQIRDFLSFISYDSLSPYRVDYCLLMKRYNDTDQIIEETYINSNGKMHCFNSYAKKLYTYDANGNLTEECYLDEMGELCIYDSEGYAKKTCTYTTRGKLLTETYFDSQEMPCMNEMEGYSRKTLTYDELDRIIKEEFFNPDGKLMTIEDYFRDNTEYAYVTYSYETNEAGEEEKKARYYDEHGNEVT